MTIYILHIPRELLIGNMSDICASAIDQAVPPVPHHAASDGVAESTIGVLTNAERTILHHLGMPKSLWAEAFSTATYIRDRTPTAVLEGRTRYDPLYDVKPDLANLWAFGAPVCHHRTEPEIEETRVDYGLGYKHQRGACDARTWRRHGLAELAHSG